MEMLGGLLCGLLVGGALGSLVGAVLLRLAISLYNKYAGGGASNPDSLVPEPTFGKAAGIMLLITVVNFVCTFLFGFIAGIGMVAIGGGDPGQEIQTQFGIGVQIGSLAITLVIMTFILHKMLPTSLDKAVLVTLCYAAVGVVVGLVLACIFMIPAVLLSI